MSLTWNSLFGRRCQDAARRESRRVDQGFTLVELLIVIVILGILSAVVVFSVAGATPNAQEQSCRGSSRTYQTAIEAWYALPASERTDYGTYGHPSGDDIESSGLVRSYDPTALEILEPADPASGKSTVAATPGGMCDGHVAPA